MQIKVICHIESKVSMQLFDSAVIYYLLEYQLQNHIQGGNIYVRRR